MPQATLVEAPAPLPTVLTLELPTTLEPARALQLAALEANLGEILGLVVEVAGQRTPAHRWAPAEVSITAQVRPGEPLALDLCVGSSCSGLEGDSATLATAVAAQLALPPPARTVWRLPEAGSRAEPLMREAAAVLYGFAPGAPRQRLGGKRDPVAQAPRELGATPLAGWIQGRRDLALGRSQLAAQVLDGVRRRRETERSRFDAVVAYLDAGWIDEAWARLDDAGSDDLRTLPVHGHVALARGRHDRVQAVLELLPAHPETSRLAFLARPEREAAEAWSRAWPTDPRAQHALRDLVVRRGGAAPAGTSASQTAALESLGTIARALETSLTDAAAADREASAAQNTFASARIEGAVPCDHPAVAQLELAELAGERQRDHTERARTLALDLTAARGALEPDTLGRGTVDHLADLERRLAEQLRAAKVLRSYQQKVVRCGIRVGG